MILVDSSVWVDFLKRRPFIFPTLQTLLEKQAIIATGCVFGELLQGAKNSRERDIIFEYWGNLPKKDEEGLWVEAGRLLNHRPRKCLDYRTPYEVFREVRGALPG